MSSGDALIEGLLSSALPAITSRFEHATTPALLGLVENHTSQNLIYDPKTYVGPGIAGFTAGPHFVENHEPPSTVRARNSWGTGVATYGGVWVATCDSRENTDVVPSHDSDCAGRLFYRVGGVTVPHSSIPGRTSLLLECNWRRSGEKWEASARVVILSSPPLPEEGVLYAPYQVPSGYKVEAITVLGVVPQVRFRFFYSED